MIKKEILDVIKSKLKYGDVINSSGNASWWEFWLKIAYYGIREYQKKLFEKGNFIANWMDTHTAIYLPEGIYSCEPPKVRTWSIDEYFDDKATFTIYRYNKKELNPNYINIMETSAKSFLGTKYDIGQLMNILVNGLLGYTFSEKYNWFDMNQKMKVCSVFVGVLFQDLRKKTNDGVERIFNKLNPAYWSEDIINKFSKYGKGWDIENLTPAHFANSIQFDNEFSNILILKPGGNLWTNGLVI